MKRSKSSRILKILSYVLLITGMILGYEKGYLLMAGITTLMTICALIVYFWKNREQRNGGDVCEI